MGKRKGKGERSCFEESRMVTGEPRRKRGMRHKVTGEAASRRRRRERRG